MSHRGRLKSVWSAREMQIYFFGVYRGTTEFLFRPCPHQMGVWLILPPPGAGYTNLPDPPKKWTGQCTDDLPAPLSSPATSLVAGDGAAAFFKNGPKDVDEGCGAQFVQLLFCCCCFLELLQVSKQDGAKNVIWNFCCWTLDVELSPVPHWFSKPLS